jgi:ERCC4-type nuclease
MLLSIPGIGREMAEKLLENCGSIEEMAFPESLKMIKGLGEVLRGRVVEVITSEEPVIIQRKRKS